MAAVSIPPSPHAIGMMASRRVPLSNVPNAANSPLRPLAGKRGRSQSNAAEDAQGGQPPPHKKQILDFNAAVPRTPTRRQPQAILERKPQVAREREAAGGTAKQEKTEAESHNQETIRQWQKHYRKVFPTYVFYFDNVPENFLRQCSGGVAVLGAREEKFFSRDVTHVVTSRPLPTDQDRSTDTTGPSSTAPSVQDTTQPHTINPSLLNKAADNAGGASKAKFTFEAPSSRRTATTLPEAETRKQAPAQVNVLQKAKDLGIKIWTVEKLQRILMVILNDSQPMHGHNTRSNTANAVAQPRAVKQNDLSQMIKNEQLHERGDREFGLGNTDLIPLKGLYIYIRDMNEKTKPIMMREYPKVQKREEGEWPQFRSASVGKCPFVEEDPQSKKLAERERLMEKEREKVAKAKAQEKAARRRLPARTHLEEMRPPTVNARALKENHQLLPPPLAQSSTIGKAVPGPAFQRPGFIRGEPMASGMQQSNITSAIRSQMISSTAPAPGAKAGTSREIHDLQRKVFERNNGPVGLIPSQRMTDIAGTAARMTATNTRAAKQKAQEKLGYRPEPVPEEDEDEPEQAVKETKRSSVQRTERKEPKPGYCENCREKFDDFDTHTLSRKHRKFAIAKENWKELDDLLSVLVRPLRAIE